MRPVELFAQHLIKARNDPAVALMRWWSKRKFTRRYATLGHRDFPDVRIKYRDGSLGPVSRAYACTACGIYIDSDFGRGNGPIKMSSHSVKNLLWHLKNCPVWDHLDSYASRLLGTEENEDATWEAMLDLILELGPPVGLHPPERAKKEEKR